MSPPRATSHRSALLGAMRELSLTKGFPATTVDEVCSLAGVTKGSFYHHFHNKDELGAAALAAYFDDLVAAFQSGDWAEAPGPVERLRAFLAHAAEVTTGPVLHSGCMLGSFALDLAATSPELRGQLSGMFGALRDMVAGLVAEAAAARRVDVDAGRFGDQFLAVVEGGIVLAKAHNDPSLPGRGIELLAQHIDLLFPPASKSGQKGARR